MPETGGRPPSLFASLGQRFGRLAVIDPETRTAPTPSQPNGTRGAACRCDCGTETTVALAALFRGDTRSCGCLKDERDRTIGAATLAAAIRSPEGRARAAARSRAKLQDPQARAFMARWIQDPENKARATKARRAVGWSTPAMKENRYRTHGLTSHPLYKTWNHMLARCHDPNCGDWKYYGARGIVVCERWHDVRLFIEDIERDLGQRPEGRSLDRIDNDGDYEPGNVRWATYDEQMANQRTWPPRACAAGCGQTFTPNRETHIYCSGRCRKRGPKSPARSHAA